jgi:hypothetical protein
MATRIVDNRDNQVRPDKNCQAHAVCLTAP